MEALTTSLSGAFLAAAFTKAAPIVIGVGAGVLLLALAYRLAKSPSGSVGYGDFSVKWGPATPA